MMRRRSTLAILSLMLAFLLASCGSKVPDFKEVSELVQGKVLMVPTPVSGIEVPEYQVVADKYTLQRSTGTNIGYNQVFAIVDGKLRLTAWRDQRDPSILFFCEVSYPAEELSCFKTRIDPDGYTLGTAPLKESRYVFIFDNGAVIKLFWFTGYRNPEQ